MKNILIYLFSILFLIVLIPSCNEDDSQPTYISTADLTLETFSSVVVNDTIGTVFGTSNKGSVFFSILSQSPKGAIKIDTKGNLIVADVTAFNSVDNSVITAEIAIGKEEVQKTATVTIDILSCPNVDPFIGTNIIFTSSFSDTAMVTGEMQTGNTCSIVYTGIDPLFTFLDCDQETNLTILLSPSKEDPTIGNLTMKKQAYGCSKDESNFTVDGEGTYNVANNEFIFNYTLYNNSDEWDAGTVTVTNESTSDTDGDGIANGEERTNGTDENDPCDPVQTAGYIGYDADNLIWMDADCDGDGIVNGDEYNNGTDPYFGNVDTDGDGINDLDEQANGTDENNPCSPAQSPGYKGYNALNNIWSAADCDGDGVTNGEEVTNETDPYLDNNTSCSNNADTSIWNGNLVSKDDFDTDGTAVGVSECGILNLTGDWVPSFSCGSDMPTSQLTFTPSSANDGTGNVTIVRQTYTPCDGIPYEIEATGTYDENL